MTTHSIKKFICPQGIAYNPCSGGGGGAVSTLEAVLYVIWTKLNKMAISQFQSDVFVEKSVSGVEGLLPFTTFDS